MWWQEGRGSSRQTLQSRKLSVCELDTTDSQTVQACKTLDRDRGCWMECSESSREDEGDIQWVADCEANCFPEGSLNKRDDHSGM
jgi:hypothetical protein